MANLMIKHFGSLGNQGFTVPAIKELKKTFDHIYLFSFPRAQFAFEHAGLIDKFILQPQSFQKELRKKYGEDAQRQYGYWLMEVIGKLKIDASVDLVGVLAGAYAFHEKLDHKAKWSKEKKIENAKGVNFFDIYTERMGEQLEMPDLLGKVKGKRPTTRHTAKEKAWLNGFRRAHGIKDGSFLLGWQFTGSAMYKDYPYFDEVIIQLKQRYPELHVVTTGTKGTEELGVGREFGSWLNLAGKVSFRQAYLLTSIYDCFVGPDTGVMVFAGGYKTPKVMFSTHTYGEHTAWPETRVIEPDCDCAPCYVITDAVSCPKADGGWPLCIDIKPDWVVSTISGIIDEWRTNYGRTINNGRTYFLSPDDNQRYGISSVH